VNFRTLLPRPLAAIGLKLVGVAVGADVSVGAALVPLSLKAAGVVAPVSEHPPIANSAATARAINLVMTLRLSGARRHYY